MAYACAIKGDLQGIPDWIRGEKLEEVNLLSPGRPMFEIIYNQVLLLQKKYAAVLGRGEALLGACRIFLYLLCEIHLHIETDGTWLLYTAESAGEELYFYGVFQMLGDGSLCMMTSDGITVATANLSGDDLDVELTEEYKWLFEDYGTTSMWFRREASAQPLENHILQVEFVSGGFVLRDMKPRLDSVWFGHTELSHDEIIAILESPPDCA